MSTRTLEERVKFDSGLSIGLHLVEFFMGERAVRALVDIRPRGIVRYLKKPEQTAMYSIWQRMKGNTSKADGLIIVWAARCPEFQKQYGSLFAGEPVARIEVCAEDVTA